MCFIFRVSQTTCPLVNRKLQDIKNRLNEVFTLLHCGCKFVTSTIFQHGHQLYFYNDNTKVNQHLLKHSYPIEFILCLLCFLNKLLLVINLYEI